MLFKPVLHVAGSGLLAPPGVARDSFEALTPPKAIHVEIGIERKDSLEAGVDFLGFDSGELLLLL
jgi:hypothetical protein